MKNKKTKAILSLTGYLLMLIAVCIAAVFVFHGSYYELVYVSGSSMSPTLNGSDTEVNGTVVDFGICDNHASAINHIKRFDIISTYYPDDYNEEGVLKNDVKRKIKRVIGLPGETFTIENGLLSVKQGDEYKYIPYSFKVPETNVKDISEKTLGEDEYWVLGDNRVNSRDCAVLNKPIAKKNIVGVLVAIEGTAQIKQTYKCSNCGKKYGTSIDHCSKCGSYNIAIKVDLVNKKYNCPNFY